MNKTKLLNEINNDIKHTIASRSDKEFKKNSFVVLEKIVRFRVYLKEGVLNPRATFANNFANLRNAALYHSKYDFYMKNKEVLFEFQDLRNNSSHQIRYNDNIDIIKIEKLFYEHLIDFYSNEFFMFFPQKLINYDVNKLEDLVNYISIFNIHNLIKKIEQSDRNEENTFYSKTENIKTEVDKFTGISDLKSVSDVLEYIKLYDKKDIEENIPHILTKFNRDPLLLFQFGIFYSEKDENLNITDDFFKECLRGINDLNKVEYIARYFWFRRSLFELSENIYKSYTDRSNLNLKLSHIIFNYAKNIKDNFDWDKLEILEFGKIQDEWLQVKYVYCLIVKRYHYLYDEKIKNLVFKTNEYIYEFYLYLYLIHGQRSGPNTVINGILLKDEILKFKNNNIKLDPFNRFEIVLLMFQSFHTDVNFIIDLFSDSERNYFNSLIRKSENEFNDLIKKYEDLIVRKSNIEKFIVEKGHIFDDFNVEINTFKNWIDHISAKKSEMFLFEKSSCIEILIKKQNELANIIIQAEEINKKTSKKRKWWL